MGRFRIMSFDGGGIRGVLTVSIVKRLIDWQPSLLNSVKFFAGTSTGSFIALGLAAGFSVEEVFNLYSRETCRHIFSPKRLGLLNPKYNNAKLRRTLLDFFTPQLKLNQLKKYVLIPSFKTISCSPEQDSWCPVFFNNFPGSDSGNTSVVDACMASSAAPVYFPAYNTCVDGGIVANNPGTLALGFAVDQKSGRQKIENIRLLSLGTGQTRYKKCANTVKWGGLQWILNANPPLPLLLALSEGNTHLDIMLSRKLIGNHYYRYNPVLPHNITLDDYNAIPYLQTMATKLDLTGVKRWLEHYWL